MHSQSALRFTQWCEALDSISSTFVRTVSKRQRVDSLPSIVDGELYVRTLLKATVLSQVCGERPTRSGGVHAVTSLVSADKGGSPRRNIPVSLIRAVSDTWGTQVKVPVTWMACYLANVMPDRSKEGWEYFECSHRCIAHGLKDEGLFCIDANCLVWESKSDNQSRGNSFCMRQCRHSDCSTYVCMCQGLHDPPCL